MPDKRDVHKAKSHRNSKSAKQRLSPQGAAAPGAQAATSTTTMAAQTEPTEMLAPDLQGKKNKSRR